MSQYKQNKGLSPLWDELLSDGLVQPPPDFQMRVINRLQIESDEMNATPSPTAHLTALLQSIAILITAMAAGWQTFAFVFGLWATAAAL